MKQTWTRVKTAIQTLKSIHASCEGAVSVQLLSDNPTP